MRILFLTNFYPPYEVGGYEQLCRDVAVRLADRGHSYAVLTSDHGVKQGNAPQETGVYRLLEIQPRPGTPLGTGAQFFLTRQRVEVRNRSIFRSVAQQVSPDVVFIWNLQGLPQELALDAEALPDVATAYWLAGYTPTEPDAFWRYWTQPPGKRAILQGTKLVLGRVALAQMRREGKPVRPEMRHVAVVSDYIRRKGLAENTLPPHTEVIYNGVETDAFYRLAPPADASPPINLLLAGRVSADKGVHVAVEAVGRLIQVRPQRDFRLLIAGNGPTEYVQQLQRLTATYEISDLISFLGWLPREQMPELMHSCHVLLLPTVHQEPFARVTLEAMAAGLAVIGTLTGGTGEILQHEVTGLACTAEDSADLARQIGRLLVDPQLRYRLATRGQEAVLARYSMERMTSSLEAMLERAVAEQSQSHSGF
ncbi:MAG: glycosyltransferase family 4 protein [Caldilineaceae bacterium]|nr:glycosyltransferase family 4 protein [Caldilineaceae bacterium]